MLSFGTETVKETNGHLLEAGEQGFQEQIMRGIGALDPVGGGPTGLSDGEGNPAPPKRFGRLRQPNWEIVTGFIIWTEEILGVGIGGASLVIQQRGDVDPGAILGTFTKHAVKDIAPSIGRSVAI